MSDQDVDRLDYELRRQSPYFQAGRVIGSAAGIAQGLFEFVIGTGGDIAGGSACATVVGCTVGAPTIAGSVALQVHGATTAVAGAKNLGKVLSEIYSVVFASSSTSGAGNNPGNLGNSGNSGDASGSSFSGESNTNLSQVGSNVHPNVPPYTGGKTQGVFVHNGVEVPLISGETGPGKWLVENLPGGAGSGLTRSWTHVEGHAAGIMRKYGLKNADLFINQIPCSKGAAKCQSVINKLIPPGSKLNVHFLKSDGSVGFGVFESGVSGFRIIK